MELRGQHGSSTGKLVIVMEMENNTETAQLYATLKPPLAALAYRMLGSVMDAEDIVHEAFISYNKTGREHISNVKAYLYKIVTNHCIDYLQSSSKQREVYVGTWLPEPLVAELGDEADPSQAYILKESVSTAYLLLLQQLSYVERAVFLLREVLQYDYDEIAEIVGKSSTNCRQIFHRAKRSLSSQLDSGEAARSEQASAFWMPSYEQASGLVEQFVRALANADVGQLMNVLSHDATLFTDSGGKVTAPPRPMPGGERISRFLAGLPSKVPASVAYKITTVNGMPGIIVYADDKPVTVFSFRFEDGQIADLFMVANPDKLKLVP
jgi:RNA polymerase sigma-70 factor (TIGR02957 family)